MINPNLPLRSLPHN